MDSVASDDGNELPPEIITNILYRLPAKSLGRFRSVSKNWLAQISEPQFIKFHQKTLNRHHIISEYYNSSLYSLPLTQHDENPKNLSPKLPHADVFVFHGSYNGLVLGSSDDLVDAYSLVVFNPTTNEFVEIPESCWEVITNLLEIDIIYGFGYDSLSDDYKVVTVSYFHYSYLIPPDNMCVHVYSLRNNTWKRVSDSPYDHSDRMSAPAVFVNGFLHWIACKGAYRVPVIVAFCIADEEFSEVPSPDLGDQVDIVCKRDCELLVVGEKLGIFVRDEVWLMNEYGVRESWLKISIHGLFEIRMVGPKILYYEDGKIVLVSGGLMGIYDVVEQSFCKTIDIFRNIRGLKIKGTYVESLVSPKLR